MANVNQLVAQMKSRFDVELVMAHNHEAETLTPDGIRGMTDFSQISQDSYSLFNSLIQPIHVRHISNLLNHVSSLKLIAESPESQDTRIVIEDDVVYGDRLIETLGRAITAMQKDKSVDITFLGLPSAQLAGDTDSTSELADFSKYYNILPVSDSYIVTRAGAAKLLNEMLPMKFPTNVQLSYAILKADVKACFSRPNVFIDGSKLGVFVSTIETNNSLILSSEYASMKSLVDAGELEKGREAYETVRFKSHPDILRLLAELEHKAGNFGKSKALYEACFAAYSANGCVLNNQSHFMKNYITACRDF